MQCRESAGHTWGCIISKQTQDNVHLLIKPAVLIRWQCVALLTPAAVRRVLRAVYFFRLSCCKDLCREALWVLF